MRSDCFVCSIFSGAVGVAISLNVPDITLVVFVNPNPVRPVTGYGVWFTTWNRICGRSFAALGVISFVEYSANNRAAAAINLFSCDSFAVKNPFHAGMDLVVNADLTVIFKYSLKERRDLKAFLL